MLFTILLALGLGLMSSQSSRMRAAQARLDSVQAKQLCFAAWQDVRVKLGTDILFPPMGAQKSFAYSEDVFDGDGKFFGTYTVIVDLEFESPTFEESIFVVTCIGKVGERGFEPRAERIIHYEIDMSTFEVIRIEDLGSL